MKDPLVDSKIIHSGEGGDVERWLESRNSLYLRLLVSCSLFLFIIDTCVVVHLAYYY